MNTGNDAHNWIFPGIIGKVPIYYIVRDNVMEVRWLRYSRSIRPLT